MRIACQAQGPKVKRVIAERVASKTGAQIILEIWKPACCSQLHPVGFQMQKDCPKSKICPRPIHSDMLILIEGRTIVAR